MNNNSGIKIRVIVTDPWDSTEDFIGTLKGEIFVDKLKSVLIYSEKGEWLVLFPRHRGQDLLEELADGKKTVIHIAWLSNKFDVTMKRITSEFITRYAGGGAFRIESA